MTDPSAATPPPDRDMVFEELERVGAKAASYARSVAEAAFRGDETTMVAHMRQLRLCVLYLVKTYKDFMDGEAGKTDGQAQRPGDGMA